MTFATLYLTAVFAPWVALTLIGLFSAKPTVSGKTADVVRLRTREQQTAGGLRDHPMDLPCAA